MSIVQHTNREIVFYVSSSDQFVEDAVRGCSMWKFANKCKSEWSSKDFRLGICEQQCWNFLASQNCTESRRWRVRKKIFVGCRICGFRTPLQIDDAMLNQSKLSKARTCIELGLLKPRLEELKFRFFVRLSCSELNTSKSHITALCANILGIKTQNATRKAMHPDGDPKKPPHPRVFYSKKKKKILIYIH